MKYFIGRKSKITGRVEYKKDKRGDLWAGEGFLPYCWRFSKKGAQAIIARADDANWHYDYFLVPCGEG